jgi:hypothetical protein
MRHIYIIVAVVCLGYITSAYSAPRDSFFVAKTYVNEGNTITPFAVAITSTAWTSISSADVTRRAVVIQTLSTAAALICVSTITTSGLACAATTNGVRIEPGGVYVDNSEAALYGRVLDATAGTVYAYGIAFKDSKDAGDITTK